MRVNQVMTRQVHAVTADASVYDAAHVLLNAGISAAPVVDADGTLIGIVSEADLMYRSEIGTVPGKSWLQRLLSDDAVLAKDYIRAHSHRVADVMTRNLVTAGEQATLGEIAMLMQRHRVKRIPIVRDGKVVGIVSRANLLQGLLAREAASSEDQTTNEAIRTRLTSELARHGWASTQTTCVVADGGVVHLWGYVNSPTVRDAYRIAAENTSGVKRVEDHMRILPPETRLGV